MANEGCVSVSLFLALKKGCEQTESFGGWVTISCHGYGMNIQPSLNML